MKFRTIFFSLISFMLLSLTSCDYSDDSGQPIDSTPSTFEIIAVSENHTILEQALIDTGLDEILNSGTYTIFAPNDDAFNAIDISNEEIANILLNHFIDGNAISSDLDNGYIKTNATENYSGEVNFIDMYVNVDGGITLNGMANVTTSDIEGNNGTVHVVDAIINLPTVVTLTASNPNFSNLATALTQENLLGTLSTDSQTSPAPFTVFVPNDDAFDNFIAEENSFDTVQQILDLPNLSDVLTYHILLDGDIRAADITDGISPVTVQGESITINSETEITVTDQNNRVINIIATDLTASNGVIHAIDNILLPTLP